MGHLVYDVATSLDGYIAGLNRDVSGFPAAGDHVDAYLARLKNYRTVIMGRNTYEFAYTQGMPPGQLPYPHMLHIVFSHSIALPPGTEIQVERNPLSWLDAIDTLKATTATDIYLCGGGQLAGMLLAHGRIDRLVLKLAPLILGGGTRLFGDVGEVGEGVDEGVGDGVDEEFDDKDDESRKSLVLTASEQHPGGVVTLWYDVK